MTHKPPPLLFARRDWALLLAVLCLAGLLLFWALGSARPGGEVVVTLGGTEYGRYPLMEDRIIEVASGGHRNVVEISGGQVRMKSADCPDKLCVGQGFIHSDLYAIVCLPHRVVVEVKPYG